MSITPLARVGILIGAGLFFAASGLISFLVFPRILRWQVEQRFVLSPEAEPYKYWKDVPVPIYCQFYFFNVTNAEGVMLNEDKPIVEEVGPYTFRESREKVNITWNENGTVSFKQIKRWYYQPHLTKGHLDDVITTLNVPMVSSANHVRDEEDFFKYAVTGLIEGTNSTLFIERKIRQLLFEGYYEELLDIAKEMGGFNVPYAYFGWFYQRNDTDDGTYTVFTGETGMDSYGYIDLWNGSKNVDRAWTSPCNQINGTAGDMWPPYKNEERDRLDIFVSDICRSVYLNYLEKSEIKGIKSRRYLADHTLFDNGKYNTDNKCFCDGNDCLPPGVLNISSCQHGSPSLISYPHFLFADPEYLNGVQGLKPDVEKHSFYLDLEPNMGIPINVAARTQVNIMLQPMDVLPFSKLTKRTLIPIFWSSQTAEVDDEMARLLLMVTEEVPHYATIGSFLLVAIGGIILISTGVYAIKSTRHKRPRTYQAVNVKDNGLPEKQYNFELATKT